MLPTRSILSTFNPLNVVTDEVNPEGIYTVVIKAWESFGLPIVIAENNGMQVPLGKVDEEMSVILRNLQWLHRAIDEGADVRGYLYWSLMDNYEWYHGMYATGLYTVDASDPTKKRTPRATATLLGRIAKENAIPGELVRIYRGLFS